MVRHDQSLSRTQIDRLGERLRADGADESDLILLHRYRRSFAGTYDHVVSVVRNDLGLQPTGRPAKSTGSIREKLKRETIRLSQMQDIAGCRVVVDSLRIQDRVLEQICERFRDVIVVDRRQHPSHGYRAIHVIVTHAEKSVEIQIRTTTQHAWAELSEKLADVFEPEIKYGGGTADLRGLLDNAATGVMLSENHEASFEQWKTASNNILQVGEDLRALLAEFEFDKSEEARAVTEKAKRALAEVEADVETNRLVLAETETKIEDNRRYMLDFIQWIWEHRKP